MNYRGSSMFSRDKRGVDDFFQETMGKGGLYAVWGSPGSGKTLFSIRLAKYLANRKVNVLLIFTDQIAPPTHYMVKPDEYEEERSMASILSAAHISKELIKKNMMFLRGEKYFSLIGLLPGENIFSSAEYNEELVKEFYERAREVVSYVIVDCGSNLAEDILSAVAIRDADSVFRLINCDLKSVSYYKSMLPILSDHSFGIENHIKVVSNFKSRQDGAYIKQLIGQCDYQLPNCDTLETIFLEGNLLESLNRDGKYYQREIERIGSEVFGV